MAGKLRPFIAVTAAVTTIDLGVLTALHRRGWSLPAADAAAIAAASAISYPLHRSVTFADDPYIRWVELPGAYVAVAAITGAVDVAVMAALGTDTDRSPAPFGHILRRKLPALVAAAAVRAGAYRWVLATELHRELGEPREGLEPPTGDVRLSVIVPAYGDADRIGTTVTRLREELSSLGSDGLEIVVVDDGSADDTAAVARAAGADQVIVHPHNRGKGAAVRTGMLAAKGRTRAFTDADLAYAPAELLALLEQVESGWDVAVGSRRHTDTATLVRAGRVREIGGRVINLLTQAVLLARHRDTQCGLKAFRADVAESLFSRSRIDGFAFDVELFHLVERDRLSLTEVPVTVTNSSRSTVRIGPDALTLLRDLLRIRRGAALGWYEPSSARQYR